jgi:hypothetical protein
MAVSDLCDEYKIVALEAKLAKLAKKDSVFAEISSEYVR